MSYDAIRRAIALKIHGLRTDRGWNQAELAHKSGVSQKTISNLEDPNSHACQLDKLDAIAKSFGLEAWQLIKTDSVSEPTPIYKKLTKEESELIKMVQSLTEEQREKVKLIIDFNK
jgi:transcriptional regulator with XRE-family HTH domain